MATLRSNKKYITDTYDLRWIMAYKDGSSKYGMWNQAGVCRHSQASLQTSDGRLLVGVQRRHKISRDISTVIMRKSDVFIGFRWLAAIGVPASLKKNLGLDSVKAVGSHQGCCLVTREEKTFVLINGDVDTRKNDEPLIEYGDKK